MAIAHRATEVYASSGTALSHNMTIPADAQVGDLLILVVSNRQLNITPEQPSGWVLGSIDATGAAHNLATLLRECQAGDPGSTVQLTWLTATDPQGGIVAYSGVDTSNLAGIQLTKILNNASGNTHTAPTITPTVADTLLVHTWVTGSNTPNWESADAGTERFQAVAIAGTARPTLFVDRPGPASGVASSAITAKLLGTANQACTMHTLALPPSIPPVPTETLRPNAALTLTNFTGAYTDIDQDPDTTPAEAGLIPTVDP